MLRLTRTSVAENLTADHVRTARAKGLSRHLVVRNHVLRNSLIPVVTFLGVNLGTLMAGAIVTEGIFNINGVGDTLSGGHPGRGADGGVLRDGDDRHLPGHDLLVDLLYAVLDPRIRYV